MRLTETTDIAFRVLIFAASTQGRQFRIGDVVAFYGVSRSTTMKVVNILTRAGLLTGQRGRTGGLRLGLAPEQINLADVARLMEDFGLVECMRTQSACRISGICALRQPLNEAMTAFLDTLGRYTLADIALNPERMFPAPVPRVPDP